MSVKEFAAQMKSAIENIKSQGVSSINCDNIIAYLDEVQKSVGSEPIFVEIEKYKADLQNWVDANKYHHEQRLEMFRSVINAGQGAIKSSFLLNGGAAVALLAFIAHLAEFDPQKVGEFSFCLIPFTLGVLAIAITSGFTYLSQWLYASPHSLARKVGFFFNIACILLGLASYGFFAWGVCNTYWAFQTFV